MFHQDHRATKKKEEAKDKLLPFSSISSHNLDLMEHLVKKRDSKLTYMPIERRKKRLN
jgi:hypothetical protein